MELEKEENRLSALEYDELTGVYTRQAFFYHAGRILTDNPDKRYCLIMSDINNFKMVNERYGEAYADRILVYGSSSLRQLLQSGIPTGRYGGDKFVALMEYDPDHVDQAPLIESVSQLKEAFPVAGLDLKIGIYNDVEHDVPVRTLCDRVLLAVRSISHQYGKTIAFYDETLREASELAQELERGMEQAYYQDQFRVYYQPKHDVLTGRLVGAEALLRWQHPQLGLLYPDRFIPVFERNGFITYADYYAWKRTCSNLRKWLDAGLKVVPVSVNTSRQDYAYPDYISMILKPVHELNLDPSLLHIEITESLFTDQLDVLGELVQNCRVAGFQIELDDFGSGYSSLNLLGTIPLDALKLDRSLMIQLENPQKVRVLSACIALGRSLGLSSIAEGIETEDQLKLLRSLQCDQIQGYYYSKPLPEDQFEAYLRANMEKEAETQPENSDEA